MTVDSGTLHIGIPHEIW